MPTAQATQSKSSNINNNDNKIAKAAAKVAEERKTSITTIQSSAENQQQQQQQQQPGSAGNKTPQDQPEFIKQVLVIIEKKVRNLEKRRGKLDEYKDTQKKGTVLNEDQLSAVSKYEEVIRTLELARELEKQFIGVANDAMKQQKKQAKKEQLEREELIKDRLKESQKIVTLLKQFGDETVRNDFLNERNGAIKITQDELSRLDEYFKLVNNEEIDSKLDTNASESAECLFNLIEGKNKQVVWSNKPSAESSTSTVSSATYNELKKLFERLLGCSYWNKEQHVEEEKIQEQEQQVQEQEQQQQHEQHQQPEQPEHQSNDQNMVQQMNNLVINDIAHQQQQQQQQQQNVQAQEEHQQHNGQQVLQQQNTSDDYVLVNSNDFHENNTHQQQQQQQNNSPTSQQNTKTFFSTLNQQGNERNINEFLNRCENNDEGLNFLQDSELQSQQKLQQQQQQESQQVNSQQQPQQQFNNYQEFNNQNDSNKDNRGGNRPYQQRGPSKYQDNQRRSTGGQGGNYQRTNGGGQSGGPRNYNGNYRPSGDRPSGDRPSGDRPSGDRPNRGGYRGGNYQNSGPRPNNGTGNGPRNYQQFNNQSQQPQTQAV